MAQENPLRASPVQFGIFLLLLVSADMAFVAVHFLRDFPPFDSSRLFSLETDKGYAEIFQYVKTWWIVVMLALIGWRGREGIYFAWMLLFAYLLGDDSMQLHEHGGHVIAKHWNFVNAFGLRGQDFGELAFSAIFGLGFLLLILSMYWRSTNETKAVSRRLAFYFGVIVFFGVFVDVLHILAGEGAGSDVLGAVEDGGEMFAVSIVCWYVMNLVEGGENVRTSLRQLMRPPAVE
jgi:hypothetical protein